MLGRGDTHLTRSNPIHPTRFNNNSTNHATVRIHRLAPCASSSSPDSLLKRRGQPSTNCRGCNCKLPVPNLILLRFPRLSPLAFANPPGSSGFAACPLRSSTDTLIARRFLKFACCVSAYSGYVRPPWRPGGGNRNRTPGGVSLRCSIAHS